MKRIFSGVQPTGDLHLGNYLGAIRNWVQLQKNYDCIFCVVDMHAVTIQQNPAVLIKTTRETAATMIASGIDPETNIIFNQSQVPVHAELAWIFNCVARLGWLNRMTQFKEKAGENREKASVGLYVYPNLMAADILAYKATHVPVGEDQKQHLELTRNIAQKFNNDYDTEIFPIPEPLIFGSATRVMSLRDGKTKMSKSDPSKYSRITITDTPDEIAKKIRKSKTDPEPLPETKNSLKDRFEATNLLGIYAALSNTSFEEAVSRFAGQQFSEFKKVLIDLAIAELSPIGAKVKSLMTDTNYIDSILHDGAQKAYAISKPILQEVHDIIGFLRP